MSGAALQRPRAFGQVVNGDMPNTTSGIKIVSNRNEINNRFPSLGFHVDIGNLPYFEVVLTVDRGLFDPARAGERQPDNFYSSRQDSGLIQTEDGKGIYLVPPVVLRAFAQSMSREGRIYYTLIAYNSLLGDNPVFAHQPDQLTQSAPSINMANDFTGTTLSHVLGMAVENLRTVGHGGKVLVQSKQVAGRYPAVKHATRSLELIRPFYDPADPASALMSQNSAFSIEREEWFAGVPNTEIFPHSAICQLMMEAHDGKRYQGTGFYIDTDRILTCAHNLSGMKSVTIIPGRNGAAKKPYSEVSVNASAWRIAPGYKGSGDWDNDLAVIDNVPLTAPNGQYFSFLNATPSDQMPIVVCGYSAGSRRVPELDLIIDGDMQHLHGGYVQGQSNPEVIEYPILTLMGASGSPVYHLSSVSGVLEALITAVHVTGEPAANGLNRGCFITPSKIDWVEGRATTFAKGLSTQVHESPQTNSHASYPEEGEDAAYGGMDIQSTNGNSVSSDQKPMPTQRRQNGNNGRQYPNQQDDLQGRQNGHGNGNGNGSHLVQNDKDRGSIDDDLEYDDGYNDIDLDDQINNGNGVDTQYPAYDDYGDDDFGIRPAQPGSASRSVKQGQDTGAYDYDDGMDQVEGMSFQSLNRSLEDQAVTDNTIPANAVIELTAEEKRQIIEYIARFQSGDARFDAMNLDGEFRGRMGVDHPYYQKAHVGLSYGIIQFTQDSGNLGRLLNVMYERDAEHFQDVFGPQWSELLQVTNMPGPDSLHVESGRSARVQAVAGKDLWEEPWVSRFRQAGMHAPFQAAQNQLAAELFLDPVLPYAYWLGLNTERGIAILYDRAVHMGVSAGTRFVVNAMGPVKTNAQRSQALRALGHESLEDFQRSLPGITVDSDFGKQTHAAMVNALRGLGTASPIEIPGYEQSLDLIMQASASKAWSDRVASLRKDANLSDSFFS
jgi:V8-like Glu-specific endopeptidase